MGTRISSSANYSVPRNVPALIRVQVFLAHPVALVGIALALFGGVMAAVTFQMLSAEEASNVPPIARLFPLIFPCIGLLMVLFTLRRGRKNVHLITNGILTTGKVTGMQPTNVKINNRTVYKVSFEFVVTGGITQRAEVRTHRTELVRDEEKERLIYDPNNPADAVLLDTLPKSVKKFLDSQELGF